MENVSSKSKVDGKVRSCALSHNRRIYFIRSHRMIRATIYDIGEYSAGMTILGWKRRYLGGE
jgi:hypothetical protein